MRMLMVSPTPKRLLTQITKIRSLILAQRRELESLWSH